MISGQDQSVGANAIGIQGKRDVNVTYNQGLSIVQMGEIMIEMQKLVAVFASEARHIAEDRMDQLREEMLKKFSQPNQANPEAFKDPDFQFLYNRAQEHYARDGNETTSSLLVELLAERSKVIKRDRMALILNEATEKVTKLTDEDVAILSVAFLLTKAVSLDLTYDGLVTWFKNLIVPHISYLRRETSAYAYLESIGCLSIDGSIRWSLEDIVFGNYNLIFSRSFTALEVSAVSPDGTLGGIAFCVHKVPAYSTNPFGGAIFPTINRASVEDQYRFNFVSVARLQTFLVDKGIEAEPVVNFANSILVNRDESFNRLAADVPEFVSLRNMWNGLGLSQAKLTSVGLAIGHANLSNADKNFRAPLQIWVQ